MGHKYSRDEILEGAVQAAVDHGLSSLTFGRLARRLGTSDRVIVYYFPTKNALVTDVLVAIGVRLQEVLAGAFPDKAADHRQMVAAAYPVLANSAVDPLFAVYFEACGLAAAHQAPFHEVAPQLMAAWVDWLADFFSGSRARRTREAEATMALVDGLLLMRHLAGPHAADRAARTLGL
ncbi:TetR family transcriptional regulator [Mycobacterium sp. BK558]|jgi:AcrR family transcriptional regulator|nr:TetR/AcrR family transcriptional regulator [Mycolicibacterium rufum]RZT25290.1 TetR family transcriptional regulator [Mycobacterium sp. BK558]